MTKVYINENISNLIEKPIEDIAEMVECGLIDPIKAVLVLKQIENKAKEYKKKIEDIAIDEISKYNGEEINIDGYCVKLKKAAGRWDFKHIPEITAKETELKELKEKYKIANKANDLKVIGEGGEIIEPARFSTGREIIVITKK